MMTQYSLQEGDNQWNIKIYPRKRKSFAMKMNGEQEFCLYVPRAIRDKQLKNFLVESRPWLVQACKKLEQVSKSCSRVDCPIYDQLTKEQRSENEGKVKACVDKYAQNMGVSYGKITLRNQKTRWGSCSATGNLNFNYRICYIEQELMEYVVVHELAHRKEMNHSPAFWQEVAYVLPDYSSRRYKLKQYTLS